MEDSDVVYDEDCPPMTEEQLKILDLVLSHEGTRGGTRKALYVQGMEQERVRSIKSLMSSMKLTLRQALDALGIPESEHEKYSAAI